MPCCLESWQVLLGPDLCFQHGPEHAVIESLACLPVPGRDFGKSSWMGYTERGKQIQDDMVFDRSQEALYGIWNQAAAGG